ncbi:integrase, partial [Rhizobium ruizarguesonis]
RNDVKAALNAAGKTYADKLPATFAKTVKDGLELKGVVRLSDPKSDDEFDDIDSQVLNDEQVRRVIEATAIIDAEREEHGDLHRMILLLATTGM